MEIALLETDNCMPYCKWMRKKHASTEDFSLGKGYLRRLFGLVIMSNKLVKQYMLAIYLMENQRFVPKYGPIVHIYVI